MLKGKTRKIIGGSVLVAGGLVAWVVAQAGPLFGTTRVVDLVFQTGAGADYCDGAHLVINYDTGKVLGNRTGSCIGGGCGPNSLWGTVGTLIANGANNKGGGVVLTDGDNCFWPDGVAVQTVILDGSTATSRRWFYYGAGGAVLNSGRWRTGIAPANGPQGGTASNAASEVPASEDASN